MHVPLEICVHTCSFRFLFFIFYSVNRSYTTQNKGKRKILTHEHSNRQYKTTDTSPQLRKARCDIARALDLLKTKIN